MPLDVTEVDYPLGDIRDFHTKFEQFYDGPPRAIEGALREFRLKFMREEIDEFQAALEAGDLNKAVDAMVDLQYVLLGTVHLSGFDRFFAEAWDLVHEKNMQKVLARTDEASTAATGRGYSLDVIKPPGWTPPDHTDLIEQARKAYEKRQQ